MLLANIPIVALSFALLAGFYWRRAKRISVYLSTITGIIWGIFCYLYYGEQQLYTWHWAIVGIPLIFIIGIVSTLIFEKGHAGERKINRFPFLPPISSSSVETEDL